MNTPTRPIAVLVAVLALPVAALGQDAQAPPDEAGVCTAETPRALQSVESLVTDDDRADFRDRTGLAGATVDDIEPLVDPDDSSICARLQRLVPKDYRTGGEKKDWRVTYFRVADRYVVTVISHLDPDEPPEELAFGQTLVASPEFEVLGTLTN